MNQFVVFLLLLMIYLAVAYFYCYA